MTPAEEPLGRVPLSWTGVHPSEPPLPPVKFVGTGLMPGRPHAAALASVDATQVGTGKPSDPMISLPLLSRCRPQNTLRLAGHRNGPGTETHESSGRTQTKGRPVHAIRPSGQPFHVEVMLELTPLAPNMQAWKKLVPDPGAHCRPPGHSVWLEGHTARITPVVGQETLAGKQGEPPSIVPRNGQRFGVAAGH